MNDWLLDPQRLDAYRALQRNDRPFRGGGTTKTGRHWKRESLRGWGHRNGDAEGNRTQAAGYSRCLGVARFLMGAAFCTDVVIQAVPFTPAGWHHPVWATLGDTLPGTTGAISLNPSATWATIVEFIPIVLLGVVAMRVAANSGRAHLLLQIIVAATTVVAAFGMIALVAGFEQVAWLDSVQYEGFLTGTFVGRAAAATYFAIGFSACAALLAAVVGARLSGERSREVGGDGLKACLSYGLAGAILVIAILNTGSRGGLVAAFAALIVISALTAVRASYRPGTYTLAPVVAVLVVFLALVWLFGGRLFDRLSIGVVDAGRLKVYGETIAMVLSRPILGQGAGTFADAYPIFRGPGANSDTWLRAHNTYLQAAAELGIPGLIVLVTGIGMVIVRIARGVSRRLGAAPAALAALGAIAGVAIQSAFDFSIQIPAVALTMVVLVGAGLGQILSLSPARESDGRLPNVAPPLATDVTPRTERITVRVPAATKEPREASRGDFGRVTEGRRVYAFGDVHGRFDLLDRLQSAIHRDQSDNGQSGVLIVGLGDYIDRGPASRRVVEALSGDFFTAPSAFLRGNHEQMLLDFLDEPDKAGPIWLRNGADATIRSYVGDEDGLPIEGPIDYRALRGQLLAHLPDQHLSFLRGLRTSFSEGGYFFAHAGARPGRPLSHQHEHDLLWIRQGFSDRDEPFEKVLVHGHTPVDQPFFGKYRINIDTGAYFSGSLTCLVLEEDRKRILSF